jgi:uncharacterized membrane protein
MFNFLLILHIIGGSISLVIGLVPIIAKKGGAIHKTTGRIFGIAMLLATFSGVTMAVIHPNKLLFLVGLFSSYLVIAGLLPIKMLNKNQLSSIKNAMVLPTVGIILASGMIAFAIYNLIYQNLEGVILMVFGAGLLFAAIADYRWIARLTLVTRNQLLSIHVGRIVGAYIASCTAFLVVNEPLPIPLLNWFIANVVFVPVIVFWQRKLSITGKAALK